MNIRIWGSLACYFPDSIVFSNIWIDYGYLGPEKLHVWIFFTQYLFTESKNNRAIGNLLARSCRVYWCISPKMSLFDNFISFHLIFRSLTSRFCQERYVIPFLYTVINTRARKSTCVFCFL